MSSHSSRPVSRGSDVELAYASPSLVRSGGFHIRKRRCRGCSDDEENLTADGFMNEDLRVGGPHLCSLPARNIHLTKEHRLYGRLCGLESQAFSNIASILQSSPIRFKSFSFVGRQSKWEPDAPVSVTAFIIARREVIDDGWLDTARKIRQYLLSQGLQEVCVEIADRRALQDPCVSPIHKEDAISAKWETVREQILESIDLTDVFFVGCYRVGHSEDVNENPPTVVILVNVQSTRDWRDTRKTVVGILAQHDLSMVAVDISKDRMCVPEEFVRDLDRAACKGPVKPGFSIGIQGDGLAATTFGATSIYRVQVASGRMYNECQNGLSDTDLTQPHLGVYSPSFRDMEETLLELESALRSKQSSESYKQASKMEEQGFYDRMSTAERTSFLIAKSQIADMESFSQEIRALRGNGHQFGYVAASGSGCRIPSTRKSNSLIHMNWALVEVDKSREGPNEFGDGRMPLFWCSEGLNDLSGKLVRIEGRSSGLSRGICSHLSPALIAERMVDGAVTRVKTITHTATGYRGGRFTRHSDSGSLVYGGIGQVVGMVIGGCEQKDITFFTRIDDLFGDIKQYMGATDIRFSED